MLFIFKHRFEVFVLNIDLKIKDSESVTVKSIVTKYLSLTSDNFNAHDTELFSNILQHTFFWVCGAIHRLATSICDLSVCIPELHSSSQKRTNHPSEDVAVVQFPSWLYSCERGAGGERKAAGVDTAFTARAVPVPALKVMSLFLVAWIKADSVWLAIYLFALGFNLQGAAGARCWRVI